MRIHVAKDEILDKILERKRKEDLRLNIIDLKGMLRNILSRANGFVPSESGSILFDDPTLNLKRQKSGNLYFVACFGKGSSSLSGVHIPADTGIVGQTYASGKAYISRKVTEDENFYPEIDKKTKFRTESIICAPIKIKNVTIGVIELINRIGSIDYDRKDLTLLKIFAEYTSTLIQNSLDAKRFGELSIRDNLTGLYNDRFFYDSLNKHVERALRRGGDLGLIFMDLDRFKEVNDVHGHLAGSRVLAEIGVILQLHIDGTEFIPTRYGGDEFVIILPGADLEKTGRFAEKLRKTIEEFVFLKKKMKGIDRAIRLKGHITASIGAASLKTAKGRNRTTGSVREALIKKADAAMYESKNSGRNRVTLAG